MTPMISLGFPSIRSVLPRTPGSPPKRACQYPCPRMTVSGVPGESSSRVKTRPIAAWTRRMGNVPSVTHITSTSSGSSSPVIETWLLSHMPMSSNVRLSSQ